MEEEAQLLLVQALLSKPNSFALILAVSTNCQIKIDLVRLESLKPEYRSKSGPKKTTLK